MAPCGCVFDVADAGAGAGVAGAARTSVLLLTAVTGRLSAALLRVGASVFFAGPSSAGREFDAVLAAPDAAGFGVALLLMVGADCGCALVESDAIFALGSDAGAGAGAGAAFMVSRFDNDTDAY